VFLGGTGKEVRGWWSGVCGAASRRSDSGQRRQPESLTATYTTLKAIAGGVQVLLVNARGRSNWKRCFEAINQLSARGETNGSSSDDVVSP
jgi:hypothetical protein